MTWNKTKDWNKIQNKIQNKIATTWHKTKQKQIELGTKCKTKKTTTWTTKLMALGTKYKTKQDLEQNKIYRTWNKIDRNR